MTERPNAGGVLYEPDADYWARKDAKRAKKAARADAREDKRRKRREGGGKILGIDQCHFVQGVIGLFMLAWIGYIMYIVHTFRSLKLAERAHAAHVLATKRAEQALDEDNAQAAFARLHGSASGAL